jgi:zinc D-Ala-D-Ala carboxypeptidase
MKYFTIDELTKSNTAKANNIDNTPTPEVVSNLTALVDNVLDVAREKLGKPISVNCGYRSPILNKKVGGAINSQHLTGEAADIESGNNFILAKTIHDTCTFDQLILEMPNTQGIPQWVHVSFSKKSNRKQVLICQVVNGKKQYVNYVFH